MSIGEPKYCIESPPGYWYQQLKLLVTGGDGYVYTPYIPAQLSNESETFIFDVDTDFVNIASDLPIESIKYETICRKFR